MRIEKHISPLIPTQFPAVYREDGPDFVDFIQTYYQWLEETNRWRMSYPPDPDLMFTVGTTAIAGLDPAHEMLIVSAGDGSIDVIGDGANVGSIHVVLNVDEGDAGLVNIAPNSRVVTGSNTHFTAHVGVGSHIRVNGFLLTVFEVTDDTTLVLSSTYTGSSLILQPYQVYSLSDEIGIQTSYQKPNEIAFSRSLLEYNDVDETLDWLVPSFKAKYMPRLPDKTMVDPRFLVKHILDLYRVKGTPRAHRLLFRILFNENVDFYLPPQHLFSASEANWVVTQYVETTFDENLALLVGQSIRGSGSNARATVDGWVTKTLMGRIVNILTISSVQGIFHRGEHVICDVVPSVSPRITGSLSSVTITNGGLAFQVGDILDVQGSGEGGKAVVSSIREETGHVSFTLVDGGFGFSLNAVATVIGGGGTGATFRVGDITNKETIHINTDLLGDYFNVRLEDPTSTLNVALTAVSGTFTTGEKVKAVANVVQLDVDQISGTLQDGEGVIYRGANTAKIFNSDGSFLELTGNTTAFVGTDILTGNISGATVAVNTVFPVRVTEANAHVLGFSGGVLHLSNVFSYSNGYWCVNSVSVSAGGTLYANGESVSITNTAAPGSNAQGFITTTNTGAISVVTIHDAGNGMISTPSYVINTANGSGATLTFSVAPVGGRFVIGEQVTGQTSGAVGTVDTITMLTNWGFPKVGVPDRENLSTTISDALSTIDLEVGTVLFLTGINPGDGYASNPVVTLDEPLVHDMELDDGHGGFKGFDAIITGSAVSGRIATSLRVTDSGFGYLPDEPLTLTTPNSQFTIAGDAVVDQHGHDAGTWRDLHSFASSTMFLQDSYYYQRFSYDVLADRTFDSYERYVRDLVHPSGLALFGTYRHDDEPADGSGLEEAYNTHTP